MMGEKILSMILKLDYKYCQYPVILQFRNKVPVTIKRTIANYYERLKTFELQRYYFKGK